MTTRLVIHPTETAQWHSLICDAESAANYFLDEELQSYLVFLLMRFLSKPDIAARMLAMDYINGLLSSGQQQHDKLREVADICLLYAGFFPRRAKRKRVNQRYFVELGSGAYGQLSDVIEHSISGTYKRLAQSFVSITDLLQTMRQLDTLQPAVAPAALYGQKNVRPISGEFPYFISRKH